MRRGVMGPFLSRGCQQCGQSSLVTRKCGNQENILGKYRCVGCSDCPESTLVGSGAWSQSDSGECGLGSMKEGGAASMHLSLGSWVLMSSQMVSHKYAYKHQDIDSGFLNQADDDVRVLQHLGRSQLYLSSCPCHPSMLHPVSHSMAQPCLLPPPPLDQMVVGE